MITVELDPLRARAHDRAALEDGTHLFATDLVLLEYADPLEALGLALGPLADGACRPLPAPDRARSHARGDESWREGEPLPAAARALRIGCEGCASGEVDARGRCLPVCPGPRASDGSCAAACRVPVDAVECAPGELLADDGKRCLTTAECASPRIADALSRVCHRPGDCDTVRGLHDGGDGRCVPHGRCTEGFVDGGGGVCAAAGTCAPGFSRDGDGACVWAGECAAGLHDGGDGLCVATTTCAAGFGRVQGLGCLPRERCPAGEHDGGLGACVPRATCAPTFRLDADGVCYRWRALAPLERGRFLPVLGPGRGLDLVVAGGSRDDAGATADVELYDAARDRWRAGPDLPEPVARASGVVLPDGRTWVVGGTASPSWIEPRDRALSLDADGCVIADAASPGEPRRMGGVVALLGRGEVLLAGGYTSWSAQRTTTAAELFSPSARAWRSIAALPEPIAWATPVRLGADRLLIAMGNLGDPHQPTRRVLAYDARDGRWRRLADLTLARVGGPLVRLAEGHILLAGGSVGGADAPTARVERYDPPADRWVEAAPLAVARLSHAAVELCDHRVLVVAGVGAAGPLASAELYDPRADRWSDAGSSGVARLAPTALRRPDCSVVVLGGADGWEEQAREGAPALPTRAHREVVVYETAGLRAP